MVCRVVPVLEGALQPWSMAFWHRQWLRWRDSGGEDGHGALRCKVRVETKTIVTAALGGPHHGGMSGRLSKLRQKRLRSASRPSTSKVR